jgi:hypothetical protein
MIRHEEHEGLSLLRRHQQHLCILCDAEGDRRLERATGFEENTSKEHERNALADILMTMSQIPDVNRELAEVVAMFATFDVLRQNRGS